MNSVRSGVHRTTRKPPGHPGPRPGCGKGGGRGLGGEQGMRHPSRVAAFIWELTLHPLSIVGDMVDWHSQGAGRGQQCSPCREGWARVSTQLWLASLPWAPLAPTCLLQTWAGGAGLHHGPAAPPRQVTQPLPASSSSVSSGRRMGDSEGRAEHRAHAPCCTLRNAV